MKMGMMATTVETMAVKVETINCLPINNTQLDCAPGNLSGRFLIFVTATHQSKLL
jgi:hypothetical protein